MGENYIITDDLLEATDDLVKDCTAIRDALDAFYRSTVWADANSAKRCRRIADQMDEALGKFKRNSS